MDTDKHKILDKIIFYQDSIKQWQHNIDEFQKMRIALNRETVEWAERNNPAMLADLFPHRIKDAITSYQKRISESREMIARLKREFEIMPLEEQGASDGH